MNQGTASNTYHLDRLIERMWAIRARLQSDPSNVSLRNQCLFIRRVVARLVDRMPCQVSPRS